MFTLSSRVGYVINATSVKNRSLSIPGISNTHTWESTPPVRRPTSLFRTLFKKFLESISPFIYISAFPSWASFTAFKDAWIISGSSIISYPSRSMPMDAAISLIFASSPTKIASAMPLFLASLTASSTASSCATETATFFIPHSPTLAKMSSKPLLIFSSIPKRFIFLSFTFSLVKSFVKIISRSI